MNKITILVCCHKDDSAIQWHEPFMPIHVGKALNPDLDLHMQGDNTGDNISRKNGSYCELTGMYWAWKNLKDVDIIGLCHYRRYFDFHNQCRWFSPFDIFNSREANNFDYSIPDRIIHKVEKGKIIISKKRHYTIPLNLDYCRCHLSTDFYVLENVINKTQSQNVIDSFYKVFYFNNKLNHYNMFLMTWDNFDKYCNWLFELLKIVESNIDITHYNVTQKRIYGYMAERLFLVWIEANRKKTIEKKVIWFNNWAAKPSRILNFNEKIRGKICVSLVTPYINYKIQKVLSRI